MLAFSNDYYGFIFRVTQSVELFCTYFIQKGITPSFVASKIRVDEQQQKKKKIGRNEPCPCGSGKKYKRCCGK